MIPMYNVFDVVPIDRFWNFIKSMLSIGMPLFLIWAAIAVVGLVLPLIITAVKSALGKKQSEDWEDSDDDDDW